LQKSDPDPVRNHPDPQHCFKYKLSERKYIDGRTGDMEKLTAVAGGLALLR
jgi:hypothetical protein